MSLNHKQIFAIFIYVMLSITALYLKPGFSENLNIPLLFSYITITSMATVTHFYLFRSKNFFTIATLFLLGFIIVHFQWPVMLSVSDIEPGPAYISVNNFNYINYGTWLSCTGLLAWLLGYAVVKKDLRLENNYVLKNYKKLVYFNIGLFGLFVATVGRDYLSGGMFSEGLDDTGIGFYVFKILDVSILVLILATIINYKDQYKGSVVRWLLSLDKAFLGLSLSFIALFLMVGDRGPALKYVIAFLLLFGSLVRPIKLNAFMAMCVVGIITLTSIGLLRGGNAEGISALQNFDAYDFTAELGNSARTLYLSLEQVPQVDDYFYGELWLGDFLAVIPKFSSVYLGLSGSPFYLLSSPSYITFTRFGLNAQSGEGSTLVADIYLNFASWGVVFFMLMLGGVMKKLDLTLRNGSGLYALLIALIIGSSALYMGRATLFLTLHQVAWGVIMLRFFVRRQYRE